MLDFSKQCITVIQETLLGDFGVSLVCVLVALTHLHTQPSLLALFFLFSLTRYRSIKTHRISLHQRVVLQARSGIPPNIEESNEIPKPKQPSLTHPFNVENVDGQCLVVEVVQ